MKDAGMIRSLDNLGRIVVPIEIRMMRNIGIGDSIEFFILDDHIIVLRKYTSTECTFCRSLENVTYFKDQFICSYCLQELGGPDREEVVPERQEESVKAVSFPEPDPPKKRTKSDELKKRLEQAMLEHPKATQKEFAVMLGVSQSRISQLKRKYELGGN
ncbi:AbrB/MazE/SpoVT family DNA-binding domain-containing protein [Paenibacillus zanthoxyli]|uniref:AbrB/MazE/SpoVT family DNA-binding domain-containing protein n=1 Tax=Paenibacillus zanthoxyli TaxID=369399 RepID=UPI00046FEF20|nr:AbrB/MazE/SpoVT family DNA-binding domain-containing protein [Paenibacillus zanthoxyli]